MANHENNGHGQSHDHDHTEGNRQYYAKGWYIPLLGLVVIALGFSLLAGFILGISGTDKWGVKEEKQEMTSGHEHEGTMKEEHAAPQEKAPEMKKEAAPTADTMAKEEGAADPGKH